MKTTVSHLTVVALLLSQLCLSAARGQVVCVSNHRCEQRSAMGAADPHAGHSHECKADADRGCGGGVTAVDACAHGHAGLLSVAPEHDACRECVHVTTPDDPPLAGGSSVKLELGPESIHWAVALAWLALPPEGPPVVRHLRPPADPTQRAERRALKSQRLLI